jgi:predicted Zn-dependent protease
MHSLALSAARNGLRYDEAALAGFQQQRSALLPACLMTTALISNLEKLLGGPRDNALLRFSLGSEYLKIGDHARAVVHLRAALATDPSYSAAWKALGRALAQSGKGEEALAAYREGIRVAEAKGDKQAAREMTVFARRLEKAMRSRAR